MENKELLKQFVISLIKRFLLDIEFLEGVMKENPNLLDSYHDFMIQCRLTKSQLQAMLDYNFYPEEIEKVQPYAIEVNLVQEN